MDLENIMISEMSEKDKYCMISLYKESKKIKQTNEYNKKETTSQIQKTNQQLLKRGGIGRGKLRV